MEGETETVLAIDVGIRHFAWMVWKLDEPVPLSIGLEDIGAPYPFNKKNIRAAMEAFIKEHIDSWALADTLIIETQLTTGRPWCFQIEQILFGWGIAMDMKLVSASPRTMSAHFHIPFGREEKKAATVALVQQDELVTEWIDSVLEGRKSDDLADVVLFVWWYKNSLTLGKRSRVKKKKKKVSHDDKAWKHSQKSQRHKAKPSEPPTKTRSPYLLRKRKKPRT